MHVKFGKRRRQYPRHSDIPRDCEIVALNMTPETFGGIIWIDMPFANALVFMMLTVLATGHICIGLC